MTVLPIKVVVRFRPYHQPNNKIKIHDKLKNVVLVDGKACYKFDHVFDHSIDQHNLYITSVLQMVDDAKKGLNNIAILAYGQTGSGKTHTMGTGAKVVDPGIIPRLINDLLEPEDGYKFVIKLSFYELYNEIVYDLLAPNRKQVDIREIDKTYVIPGITQCEVTTPDDAMNLLRRGMLLRKTAATAMNSASSRSHAFCDITLLRIDAVSGNVTGESKIQLVDLAGSETIKKSHCVGDEKKAGVNINMGLLNLGVVIERLASTQPQHIPYSSSPLTRLLQACVNGTSRTLMIFCVSGDTEDSAETINTLRYADRARRMKPPPIAVQVARRPLFNAPPHKAKPYDRTSNNLIRKPLSASGSKSRNRTPLQSSTMNMNSTVETPKEARITPIMNRLLEDPAFCDRLIESVRKGLRRSPRISAMHSTFKENMLVSEYSEREFPRFSDILTFKDPESSESSAREPTLINGSTPNGPSSFSTTLKTPQSLNVSDIRPIDFAPKLEIYSVQDGVQPKRSRSTRSSLADTKRQSNNSKTDINSHSDNSKIDIKRRSDTTKTDTKRQSVSTLLNESPTQPGATPVCLNKDIVVRRRSRRTIVPPVRYVPSPVITKRTRRTTLLRGNDVTMTTNTPKRRAANTPKRRTIIVNNSVRGVTPKVGGRRNTIFVPETPMFTQVKPTAKSPLPSSVKRPRSTVSFGRPLLPRKLPTIPYKAGPGEFTPPKPVLKKVQSPTSVLREHRYNILAILNSGNIKQLQKLVTIGPKAAAVLALHYSLKGQFSSIEDLKNVSALPKSFYSRFCKANMLD